ncbi:hypothetical protein N658DRAFT_551871 [Parathielavia hyrcaniae]|uniref:VWFA domain-containing protein n=1 Tax=Parathielavia hyrcaniae TaxID=113614 RepID=A0AAN6PSA1_9PEZI|nr:hypothetical protein N658DRAFT_551871 [Parathielavia hyrcaniae]
MALLSSPGRFGLILLSLISSFLVPDLGVLGQIPTYEIETANFLAEPISNLHGLIPMPWACGFMPNPGTQTVLQFHANWHCTYPDTHAEFGRRFFGFHKQFGLAYNFYLMSLNFPYVDTFYPGPGAIIPPSHSSRPQNFPCVGCTSLPNSFRIPPVGSLNSFPTVQALGQAIVGWHNNQHFHLSGGFSCGSQTTPARGDMNCFTTSPRDPVFWRYHSIFDEIQDAWHSLQDANVALVMDRSGSMALTIPSFGITRLQAAKDAAQMFADMVDVTSGHRLGLVTFSSGASTNLGLTGASTFSGALSSAMSSVSASGSTSIGAGLNAGQTLVMGGTQPRKGIVLLTDGQENVAPMISSVNLGDTHLCAVGFASPSNLNGAKLRNLAEKQGGVWTSTEDPVELKKVFVQCFSNIFDDVHAVDPMETLPYSSPVGPPTIHGAMGDNGIVFVLGWADPSAKLQLSITTPSGAVVNLNSPNVQSKLGSTWHVVRITLPYQGERDGDWSGRAVLQPIRGYVNGFSSLAVTGTGAGVQLIQNQLATLCTAGCGNVLFYQHTTNETSTSHGGGTSIYHQAVIAEMSRGNLGNATVANTAADFAKQLSRGWDLVVYNAPGPGDAQPYDQTLSSLLCGGRTKYILSDARPVSSADAILRCAGATRREYVSAGSTEKMYLTPGSSQLFPGQLQLGSGVVRDARSYVVSGGSAQVSYGGGLSGAASVAIGPSGSGSVQYFISVLAKSSVKLKPYTYINNTYVGEVLHPSFYVPAPYWPDCGFTHVYGNVTVTRPLSSLAAVRTDPKDDNAVGVKIPTETATYSLSDDGRGGDRAAGDHRFETALSGITRYDGEYKLHARIRLCNQRPCGKLDCIVREAEHVLDVLPKAAQAKTSVKVRQLDMSGKQRKRSADGQKKARVVVTPRDEDGAALGHGHLEQLVARGVCGAVVEKFEEISEDGEEAGSYAATVSYPEGGSSDASCKRAGVAIHMLGRPQEAVVAEL